jgi:hypothetical protein
LQRSNLRCGRTRRVISYARGFGPFFICLR